MARSADPDSAGSQFFICDGKATWLNNKYTAFGKLIAGEEVLNKIADIQCFGPEGSTPTEAGVAAAAQQAHQSGMRPAVVVAIAVITLAVAVAGWLWWRARQRHQQES